MAAIYPVILAGGSGSRLWPLSRQNCPKQFIDPLDQGESLLQSTVRRAKICSDIPPLIIANQDHRFLLTHQIEEVGLEVKHVLLESEAKNTASSVLLAALEIASHSPDALLLIMPADHYISNDQAFAKQISAVSCDLGLDELVLLGVKPVSANPNYGYLDVDFNSDASTLGCLVNFVEKPKADVAQVLIRKKGISWNSGMVLARAGVILALFEKHQPSLFAEVGLAYREQGVLFDFRLVDLSGAQNISFDCAVLEKDNQNVRAALLDVEWDDIGTWPNLIARRKKLGLKQVAFGDGRSRLYLTDKEVVLVDDHDLVMVADVDRLSDMSVITNYLVSTNQSSLLNGLDVHRPWGSFKVLAQGDGFLVKQLSVFPGRQISLQSHESRVENWVVVTGVASVQLDGCDSDLVSGQSLRIGVGQVHRLCNKQAETLQIIEVQTGLTLDESDIVRYDDDYLRHL